MFRFEGHCEKPVRCAASPVGNNSPPGSRHLPHDLRLVCSGGRALYGSGLAPVRLRSGPGPADRLCRWLAAQRVALPCSGRQQRVGTALDLVHRWSRVTCDPGCIWHLDPCHKPCTMAVSELVSNRPRSALQVPFAEFVCHSHPHVGISCDASVIVNTVRRTLKVVVAICVRAIGVADAQTDLSLPSSQYAAGRIPAILHSPGSISKCIRTSQLMLRSVYREPSCAVKPVWLRIAVLCDDIHLQEASRCHRDRWCRYGEACPRSIIRSMVGRHIAVTCHEYDRCYQYFHAVVVVM